MLLEKVGSLLGVVVLITSLPCAERCCQISILPHRLILHILFLRQSAAKNVSRMKCLCCRRTSWLGQGSSWEGSQSGVQDGEIRNSSRDREDANRIWPHGLICSSSSLFWALDCGRSCQWPLDSLSSCQREAASPLAGGAALLSPAEQSPIPSLALPSPLCLQPGQQWTLKSWTNKGITTTTTTARTILVFQVLSSLRVTFSAHMAGRDGHRNVWGSTG